MARLKGDSFVGDGIETVAVRTPAALTLIETVVIACQLTRNTGSAGQA